ncbi:hypothetical protein DAI22_05g068800 [Oryza sativa Japonica Group]|nr:hypothetical protein DAI22_05g068800 [Oryza sativa Japonica Group]
MQEPASLQIELKYYLQAHTEFSRPKLMAAVDGAAAAVEIRRWQQRGFEMLRLVAAVTQNQRWLQGLFGSGRGSSGERRHGHVAGSWLTVCSLVQCLGGTERAAAVTGGSDGRMRRLRPRRA